MSISGINGNQDGNMGIYANRSDKPQNPGTGIRKDDQEEEQRRMIGPAFKLESSGGVQKPFIYNVQKDDQGNMKILFGQKAPASNGLDDAFLNRVHDAFNKADLPAGTYSVWEDGEGKLHIEDYAEAEPGELDEVAEEDDTAHTPEKLKADTEKTDGTKDDKDADDGWNWMIMELIPDPDDPDNPYKARRRIVAQGKGRTPGVDSSK